jgi:hypothetical protein
MSHSETGGSDMQKRIKGFVTASALLFFTLAAQAEARPENLVVQTLSSPRAVTQSVEVHESEAGVSISGLVRQTAVSPSRRLSAKVRVEFIDAAGEVVMVRYADVRRRTPAKHTNQGIFRLDVPALPERVQAVRVGYGF